MRNCMKRSGLFQREGATVIAADSNEEALEKASEKENVHGMRLDVSSNEAWDTFAKDVKEKFGSIDVLVNNAGVSSEKLFVEKRGLVQKECHHCLIADLILRNK